jgi:flagellin-like protein
MRKGISPLIASVMLIAATMSLAGILAYWSSNFVKTALPGTSGSETTCQSADFQIYQCQYSNATQTISFVLYNNGTVALSALGATVFDMHNLPTWSNITLSGTVPAGQFVGYSLPNIPQNFTKMIITSSMCPSVLHDTNCARS